MRHAMHFIRTLLLQLVLGVLGIPWESDQTRDVKAASPRGLFILGLTLAIAAAGILVAVVRLRT